MTLNSNYSHKYDGFFNSKLSKKVTICHSPQGSPSEAKVYACCTNVICRKSLGLCNIKNYDICDVF